MIEQDPKANMPEMSLAECKEEIKVMFGEMEPEQTAEAFAVLENLSAKECDAVYSLMVVAYRTGKREA